MHTNLQSVANHLTERVKILLTQEQIQTRVRTLAHEIQTLMPSDDVVVIGVLTGCLMFLADLVRHIEMPLRIGFVQAKSYRGTATTAGSLEYQIHSLPDVANRHVLLVDDIFDSGQTLDRLTTEIAARQPARLMTAVLLAKSVPRQTKFHPDLIGFEIPPEFVVGYGLDYDGRYRNLPYIGVLDQANDTAVNPPGEEPGN